MSPSYGDTAIIGTLDRDPRVLLLKTAINSIVFLLGTLIHQDLENEESNRGASFVKTLCSIFVGVV